ncbi:unnamed protein product, partial [Allacma fusca]
MGPDRIMKESTDSTNHDKQENHWLLDESKVKSEENPSEDSSSSKSEPRKFAFTSRQWNILGICCASHFLSLSSVSLQAPFFPQK